MPGTELPQQSHRGQGGEANQASETSVDDYYTTFTHSEVCDVLCIHTQTCTHTCTCNHGLVNREEGFYHTYTHVYDMTQQNSNWPA